MDRRSVVITGVAASRSCNWECYVARQLVRTSEKYILVIKLTGPQLGYEDVFLKLRASVRLRAQAPA